MANVLSEFKSTVKNWWAFEVLGVLLVLMSLIVFARPVETYAGLVMYFVLTFFVSGILRIVFSLTNRETLSGWGWYMAGGIFDVILGMLLATRMDIVSITLPFFAGFYLLFSSIAAIGKSYDLKAFGVTQWSMPLLIGIAGIVFSCLILFNPVLGIETLILWTALAFLFVGVFYMTLGFKLRRLHVVTKDFIQGPTVHA